jgi:glycosyltransferase involved in cell wall biosynthesis
MPRGRGKKQNTTLVKNKSKTAVLGIGQQFVEPGQMTTLSEDEMQNTGVGQWLKQGVLQEVPLPGMIPRLVKFRPRILVIVHTLFRGGAEMSTMELHKQLKKSGCSQALVNIYAGDTEFHTMLKPEAQKIFDVYDEYKLADKSQIMDVIYSVVEAYNPDIVMYSLIREVPQVLLEFPDRPPCIQVMHSQLGDSKWGYDPIGTDAIITVSKRMADDFAEEYDVPEEKMFTVWNGIDPARLHGRSMRHSLGISNLGRILGMVGNMNDLKRPMLGLELFASIRLKDDYMIFAGNPSDCGNQVMKRAKELKIDQYVHILGLRDDIGNVYKTLDIMLNCSTTEGLPMTIIEAMYLRVPVVASNVGGNSEVIVHGETGYLYNPDSFDEMRSAVMKLWKNKRHRRNMGITAHERAMQYFHIEKIGQQYLDVIKKYTIDVDDFKCSVVMPVWNGGKWLDRAIWSVRKQTMPLFEFIIVDDGSTDNSLQIIKRHQERDRRIKCIHIKDNSGIVNALNIGIKSSHTPYIARMDADDEMLPTRLEMQMDYLDEYHEVAIVGTQMLARSAGGQDMGPMHQMPIKHEDIIELMANQNPMCHPTTVFRKQAWQKVGGYKGDGRCEDYRLWTDMAVAGYRFANMKEALLIYQHTHEGDSEYSEWRDSILQQIRDGFTQRMVTINGR